MTEVRGGLPILTFPDAASFEAWLGEQNVGATGAWIKLAKKRSLGVSLSKAEAIDAALSFGWIDGQLDVYDDEHWLIRFTPRKIRGKWSQINRSRALQLIAEGRMQKSGLAQIEAAKKDGRGDAAYASASSAEVPVDLQQALDANPKAARFFSALTGANRYAILYRISAVKRAETRSRKIAEFVAMLERGETFHGPLSRNSPRT